MVVVQLWIDSADATECRGRIEFTGRRKIGTCKEPKGDLEKDGIIDITDERQHGHIICPSSLKCVRNDVIAGKENNGNDEWEA